MKIKSDNDLLLKAYDKALVTIDKNKIGLLQEHTLHRTLKFYYDITGVNHEIKINGMFADVCLNNHIYEIQTKQLGLLRDKLSCFLNNYQVTICYPISFNKQIKLYNDLGEIVYDKKSPKHETIFSFLKELYKIKSFIKNPNLSFNVISLDMLEERIEKEKTYKSRKGFERNNQIPLKINEIYSIYNKEDYFDIIKDISYLEEFTSTDFKKVFHLNKNDASTILNVLNHLEIVERIGKKNRSYIYKIKN